MGHIKSRPSTDFDLIVSLNSSGTAKFNLRVYHHPGLDWYKNT